MKTYTELHAYQAIQNDVIAGFSSHLNKKAEDIKTIVIVGAYWGVEIGEMLNKYPNSTIYAFEAYPMHFDVLRNNYKDISRVKVFNKCVCNKTGITNFFELSVPGSGSIREFQGDKFGHEFKIKEILPIPSTRLCDVEELKDREIDLLWVDVQGAEIEVLKGADLTKCNAMFLEIKTRDFVKDWDKEPYKGMCYLDDLKAYVEDTFTLHSIGLDNESGNGFGNSFWISKRYSKDLSILICSMHRRKHYLERLSTILKPQLTSGVEVLCSVDNGEESIGSKRQRLLESAKGEYIAFIDDDDTVSSDYVKLVLNAIKSKPDVVGMHLTMMSVDAMELQGVITGDTYHSLKYTTWYDEPLPGIPHCRKYFRNPNHLNPVKKDLALRVGFPSISMGEDRAYSSLLLPHLKTEQYIEKPIYFYLVRNYKEV